VDIKGGAFAVPELGRSFSGLDTRIDLKPDEVTISEFHILDKNKKPMTIGGSLAVHERSVGAVDIKVQSDDFKIAANKALDLKFDTDVHVTGTVRAPKVEGSVEVEPGTIDVAEVLRVAGSRSAYSTTATEISPENSAGPEPTTPAVPGVFDALELRLGLAIPGDLLLKGNNIKPASAPIDVGDMNAYVGGAVTLEKASGGRLRLIGEVNTVRGNYTFQGRRFDIMRDGRIRFQGSEVIDPLLDLTARRIIQGVETFVHVRGSMLQPELSFSSNPPQDESDILSLIIFGTPTNELGEGQQVQLAVRAQELAGGYLASGLSEAIGGALNLDEFEIQAAGENRRTAGEQGNVRPPAPGIRRRTGDGVHSRISVGELPSAAGDRVRRVRIAAAERIPACRTRWTRLDLLLQLLRLPAHGSQYEASRFRLQPPVALSLEP
jgi:translocation and assembly module TamB